MIRCEKYKECFPYEATDQDLHCDAEDEITYRSGAVLIFPDEKDTSLQVEALQRKIDQRDELLLELSEKLRCKSAESDSLRNNLQEAHDIIATAELSRDEMVDDLTEVSVDNRLLEVNLQRAIAEKIDLEAELASRLAEIVELNLANSELEGQLLLRDSDCEHSTTLTYESGTANPNGSDFKSMVYDSETRAGVTQNLNLPYGREVYICHQFSGYIRHDIAGKVAVTLKQSCYITLIIVSLLIVIAIVSIFTTAAINQTTAGEALDALITQVS